MRRSDFKVATLFAAVIMVAGAIAPAVAQVAPPRRTVPGVSRTLNLPADPKLRLVVGQNPIDGAPVFVATSRGFDVEVSGLRGASEAHLYDFAAGCGFEQQPRLGGLSFQRQAQFGDREMHYTSDRTSTVFAPFQVPEVPRNPGVPVNADGVVRFSTVGVFGVTDLESSSFELTAPVAEYDRNVAFPTAVLQDCQPSGRVVWKDAASGQWVTKNFEGITQPLAQARTQGLPLLRGRPWSVSKGELHRIENTADLVDTLKPAMRGLGTCSGFSETVSGKFPVGARTIGDDLAFTIRSGPGGTRCGLITDAVVLPDGVEITDLRVSVDKVGSKCRLGSEPTLPADILGMLFGALGGGFRLDRTEGLTLQPRTVTRTGVQSIPNDGYWLDPLQGPSTGKRVQWRLVMPGLAAMLQCETTAVNDHAITLRIDSISYRSPPGVTIR